jgi:hypothetical protein
MLELKAASFYGVTSGLQTLRSRVARLIEMEFERSNDGGVIVSFKTDPVNATYMQEQATELLINLEVLEAEMSTIPARKMLEAVSDPRGFLWSHVLSLSEKVHERLIDELSLVKVFVLEKSMANFYEQPSPLFGSEVDAKFPSASYEIEEAGKCLALGRTTASAFHSIRCLEAGIRAIARCLGISDPTKGAERSWMIILRTIKAEIDRRWPPSHIHRGDADFFGDAYASLSGMQNPWRNATMHLDQTYTTEHARHILDVVGGLMKKLASRLDERGEPKA